MSAVFSNELAVHMFLEEKETQGIAASVVPPIQRSGSSIMLNRTGSVRFRPGSFSELMARTHDEERTIFDGLFPEPITDKDRTTFYRNPLAKDNQDPVEYVIPEPDEKATHPRSIKFSSLLGLFRSDSPPTPGSDYSFEKPKSRAHSTRSLASNVANRRSFSLFQYNSAPSTPSSGSDDFSRTTIGSNGRDSTDKNNQSWSSSGGLDTPRTSSLRLPSFKTKLNRANTAPSSGSGQPPKRSLSFKTNSTPMEQRPMRPASFRIKLSRSNTTPIDSEHSSKRPMSVKIKNLFRRDTDLR